MEGEEEILKGTEVKYFELFPERSYKQGKRKPSTSNDRHSNRSVQQAPLLKFIFVWLNLNSIVC